EDEWEWEIVMARARVTPEPVAEPVAKPAAKPTAEPAPPTTMAAGSGQWRARTVRTEPGEGAAATPVAKRVPPPFATAFQRSSQVARDTRTVIPVPSLPAVADPAAVARSMTPVRHKAPSQSPSAVPSVKRVATRR